MRRKSGTRPATDFLVRHWNRHFGRESDFSPPPSCGKLAIHCRIFGRKTNRHKMNRTQRHTQAPRWGASAEADHDLEANSSVKLMADLHSRATTPFQS
jgi:hypothetical protein